MVGSARTPSRRGHWLAIGGGILCASGFLLPWVRYHIAYGGSELLPNGVAGNAWSGLRTVANDLLPIMPYSVSSLLMMIVATLPLLMALVAVGAGAVARWRGAAGPPRGLTRAYWAAATLGTLALLFMAYALDPLNLRGANTLVDTWQSPPSLEPGIFLAFAGALAILVGGLPLRAGAFRRSAARRA